MNNIKIMGAGGFIAAGIGAVCCAGPVVLAGLGLGAGALTFARNFGFLEMPMMLLAVGLFGTAFFYHLKKKTADSGEACCEARPGKN